MNKNKKGGSIMSGKNLNIYALESFGVILKLHNSL